MAAFCVSCGCKVNSGDKFCFKCGTKVPETSLSGRESKLEEDRTSSFSSTKSLSQFLFTKAEERSGFSKPNKSLKRKANNTGLTSKRGIDNRVVILISENEEGKLAIVRGSKVALRVGKDFGAREVCEAAVKKHSDHDQFFCGDDDYILLYPDQKAVVKVPGSDENFSVAKYKQELARPYSKVDLFICKESDFKKDREIDDQDQDVSDQKKNKPCKDDLIDIPSDDDSMFDYSVFDSPGPCTDGYQISPVTGSCGSSSYGQHALATCNSSSSREEHLDATDGKKTECPTCHCHFLADEIAVHADLCAENALRVSFLGLTETPPADDIPDEVIASMAETSKASSNVLPLSDILSPLVCKLESQLRINVRRGQLFLDYVETRKRCSWIKPENRLKVIFVGEPAEDSGGPRRESFSEVLKETKGRLFASGIPMASTAALADNEFLYAGHLMVASILQGGVAPCFLKKWVYDYMFMGLSSELELSADDITASEMKDFVGKLLQCKTDEDVQALLCSYQGFDVLDNICFRGVPSKSNLQTKDKILRTILIGNIVQERLPMVSQLMEGLKPCGILAVIKTHPEEMRPLFCISDTEEKLDEEKFMSLFEVNFSLEQQKKAKEINTYKRFCDYVGMVGHRGK